MSQRSNERRRNNPPVAPPPLNTTPNTHSLYTLRRYYVHILVYMYRQKASLGTTSYPTTVMSVSLRRSR